MTVTGLPSDLTYSYSAITDQVTVSGTLSANVSGTSTVTVTADDGCNTEVSQTFEIEVDVNSAPTVTAPGNMSYFQHHTITPFTITVRDEDDTPTVTVGTLTIPNGISYSESSSSYGNGGAEITYTFSGTVDASPGGFYIIGVSADDGTNIAVSGGLLFTVKENTSPVITNPGNKFFVTGETVGKDITPFSISVSDAEDNPTVTVSGLPDDLSYDPDTGQVSGTLDAALPTQTYNVTVSADDGCNPVVTETFQLSVILNRAPVITNPGNKTFETGQSKGKDITAFSFSVARVDDAITVTVDGLPDDLTSNYDTNTQQVTVSGELDANVSGTSTVTVTADDDCNDPVTETFTIRVNVNRAPVISNPGNKTFETGQNKGKPITAFGITVTDPDDTPTVTVTGLPSGLSYSNGQVSGTLSSASSARTYTATVSADDDCNDPVTRTFTVRVNVNRAPTISTIDNQTFKVGENTGTEITEFTFTVRDEDDTPTVTKGALPNGLRYEETNRRNIGTGGVQITYTVKGTLPANRSANTNVTVSVDDGCNPEETEEFNITVDVNRAPTISTIDDRTFKVGENTGTEITEFTFTVRDWDDNNPTVTKGALPNGLRYEETNRRNIGNGGVEITYTVKGTLPANRSANTNVTVSVDDGCNPEETEEFNITVDVNRAPTISTIDDRTFKVGENTGTEITEFTFTVRDWDDNNPTVTKGALPNGLRYEDSRSSYGNGGVEITYTVKGTLPANRSANTNVTVSVDDDFNDPVTEEFAITVSVNQAPEIDNPGIKSFETAENKDKDINSFSFRVSDEESTPIVTVSGLPSKLNSSYSTSTKRVTVDGKLGANVSGTSTVTVTADDGFNDPVTEEFAITVSVNQAPEITGANFQSYYQCEIIDPFTVTVTDPDDTPNVTVSRIPPSRFLPPGLSYNESNGEVEFSGTVDPDAPTGDYIVKITADDGCNTEATAVFRIVVRDNTPPVISVNNQTFETGETEGKPITAFSISVTDAEDTPSVTVNGLPSGLTYNTGTGQVSGTLSSASSDRTYTVTVRADDGCNTVVIKTFEIEVDVNRKPVITVDNQTFETGETEGKEITPFSFSVSDAEDTPTVTVSGLPDDLDDDYNTNTERVTVSGELFSASSDRTYTVTVTADDGCNDPVTEEFTITVNVNRAPVITVDNQSFVTGETQDKTITPFTFSVSDAEDTPSVTVSGLPNDLTYNYDENNGEVEVSGTLPANASGTSTVTVSADDDCNDPVTRTFTITVGVNEAPVISNPGNKTFVTGETEGKDITSFTFSVSDAEDTPTVTVSGLPDDLDDDYNENTEQVTVSGELSSASSAQTYTVTVTADDGCNDPVTEDFTITVNVNKAPVITVDNQSFVTSQTQDKTITPFTFSVTDAEDSPDVTVSGLPFDFTSSYNTNTEQVTVSGILPADMSGTSTVTVTANDGCNDPVTETFTITVGVNPPPVINHSGDKNFKVGETEGKLITPFTIRVSDLDDTPSVTKSDLPSGLSYSESSSSIGTGGVEITYTVSGTLPANTSVTSTVTVTADDGTNPVVTESFAITVSVNRAPVITDPGIKSYYQCEEITSFAIEVTDAEDSPEVEVTGLPSGLSYNPDTDQISGTVAAAASAQDYTVTISADDGCNPAVTRTFTITVRDNTSPTVTDPGYKSYYKGETIESFDIIVTDAEDTPSVEVSGLPPGLSYGNGQISGTVSSDALVQDYGVSITADDDCNDPVTETFTINVNVNNPPVITTTTFSVAENITAVGTVEASDSDTEDNIEGYEITGGADQAQFSIVAETGVLTFQTAPNFEASADADNNNTYILEVTATSGTGARALSTAQTLTITVTDVDEPPGAPDAPVVSEATLNSLTITWTAPDNMGPEISAYDVRYILTNAPDKADANWTEVADVWTSSTGGSLEYTIGSLMQNKGYDVQVRAENDEETGDWSESGTGSLL